MSLGTPELIVIFVLILLLFGPNRLPELARGLGKGMREVRKVTSEFQNQLTALGEHDEEPRRTKNDRTQDNPDHRTASYDSNTLASSSAFDNSIVDDKTSDNADASPESDNQYAARSLGDHGETNHIDGSLHSNEQSLDVTLPGPIPHEGAPHADAPRGDAPTANEQKPSV
jgi:TatA/E family protein of Tat protein translocase